MVWCEAIDGRFDFIHFFTRSRSELEEFLPRLDDALQADGMIWISWPKKASKVPTEVDEGLVRATALARRQIHSHNTEGLFQNHRMQT